MRVLQKLVGAVVPLACGLACAAETGSTPEQAIPSSRSQVFQLGEVVVVSGRPGRKDLAATVSEVDRDMIEAIGARNAGDILQMLPGGFVRTGGEGEALLRLRGYRHREIKVLVDGIPVNNPYTGRQDLNQLPASSIAKVRVLKGGSSVLYGPNALGGVVEIITHKPGDKPSVVLTGEVGSEEYWRSTLQLALPHGDWYTSLSLDATDRNGFPVSDGYGTNAVENGGTRENSDFEQTSGVLKLGYETEETKVGISLSHWQSEFGRPPAVPPSTTKYERTEDVKATQIAAVAEQRLSENVTGRLALHADREEYFFLSFTDENYDTRNGEEDARDDVAEASASLHVDLGPWSYVSVAYGIQGCERDAEGYSTNKKGKVTTFELTERSWLHYLALEDEIALAENLTLTAGVRGDEWRSEKRRRAFNWNVGLAWLPIDQLRIAPSFYRRTQFPSLQRLYEMGTNRGNPDLDPEQVTGVNLDVQYAVNEAWEVHGAVFYDLIDDLIDRDATDTYNNIDEARHRGFEVGLAGVVGQHVSVSCDYTYLDAEDRSGDVVNTTLRNRPEHKVDSRVTYEADCGFQFTVCHTWMSKQYVSEDNFDTIRPSNIFNVAASQRIGENARVYARVENLFDYNYYYSNDRPAQGRAFFVGAELTY